MKPKRHSLFSAKFIIPNIVLLIFVAVCVQSFYRFYVRPRAQELMFLRSLSMKAHAQNPTKEMGSQPLILIIKDREPMWEITFFLWGTLFLVHRLYVVHREQRLLEHDFVGVHAGERILPDGALERFSYLKTALAARPRWRERVLPSCVLAGLQRFHATASVSEASLAIKDRTDRAADEFDSSLSLVRFIAWAIPAIGFVGTVRGIGDALSFAEEAVQGNISAVTSWLGLAFNSTLVGLFLCIFLMYFIHIVQSTQESVIIAVQTYCSDHLLDVMKRPADPELDRGTSDIGTAPFWST